MLVGWSARGRDQAKEAFGVDRGSHLNCVQGGTLAKVIRTEEKCEAPGAARDGAQPSDEHRIAAGSIERHGGGAGLHQRGGTRARGPRAAPPPSSATVVSRPVRRWIATEWPVWTGTARWWRPRPGGASRGSCAARRDLALLADQPHSSSVSIWGTTLNGRCDRGTEQRSGARSGCRRCALGLVGVDGGPGQRRSSPGTRPGRSDPEVPGCGGLARAPPHGQRCVPWVGDQVACGAPRGAIGLRHDQREVVGQAERVSCRPPAGPMPGLPS